MMAGASHGYVLRSALPIVFLLADVAAGLVLFALNPGPFARRYLPVTFRTSLRFSDVSLLSFQACGLGLCYFTGLYTIPYARTLILLPLIGNRCRLRGCDG